MLTNKNLYDRLDTCVVGRTWPANSYDWITDSAVREPLQRIASETEQDLDGLANLLRNLDVNVLRPCVDAVPISHQIIAPPPMCPGDYMCMIDSVFVHRLVPQSLCFAKIFEFIAQRNLAVTTQNPNVCAATNFQFEDKVIYSANSVSNLKHAGKVWSSLTHRICQPFHLPGHIDGWFSAATPGLVISDRDPENSNLQDLFFQTHFANWHVVYQNAEHQSQHSIQQWQTCNQGSWWIAGEDSNRALHDFVGNYLHNWVGQANKSAFDVNILVIDASTVIIRETDNRHVLSALQQHGVTVYQVPFRHAFFWDGSINCVTLPLSRR